MSYRDRLQKVIPGGAHTYSRGGDQHPANAPQILARGKGAYVFDDKSARFLDYGMALRAVNIGYAEDEIDEAAIREIRNGDNLTLPTLIELEAAERFCELIDSVDMVKFTKNGSTSVSAAVKLARAFTGRELVARCAEHPFFSYDDWFIGSTPLTKGIPAATIEQTKQFRYNDAASVRALFDRHPGEIACVVMEAATTAHPEKGFLQEVRQLCTQHGAVLIFDEMITGFRWHLKGAQSYYGVQPDLCTFGKAMANGFSVSCVGGRREIMELGSIEKPGRERVFLLSTTHGAEMAGMGAFVATLRYLEREPVIEHLWRYGQQLVDLINSVSREFGTQASLSAAGVPCSPYYTTLDRSGKPSLELRTLFAQEMVRSGVLMPWIALSYRHREAELALTEKALRATLPVYRRGLEQGCAGLLLGEPIKPVFRKFN
jgi:glutamate-1-semialdehyde 2,1-aminomutase